MSYKQSVNKRLKRRLHVAVIVGVILVILSNAENCYAFFRATQKVRHNTISTATFAFSTENVDKPFRIQASTTKETVTVKNTGTIPLQFDVTHLSTLPECKDLLFYETDNKQTLPLSRFLPRKVESKKTDSFVIYLSHDTERRQEVVCDISFSIEAWQVNFHSNRRGFTQTAKLHYQLVYVPPEEIVEGKDSIAPAPETSDSIPTSEDMFEKELPTHSAPNEVEEIPIEQKDSATETKSDGTETIPFPTVNTESVEQGEEDSSIIVD